MKFYSSSIVCLLFVFSLLNASFRVEEGQVPPQQNRFSDIIVPFGDIPPVPQYVIAYAEQIQNGPYFGISDYSVKFFLFHDATFLYLNIDITDNKQIRFDGKKGDYMSIRVYRFQGEECEIKLGYQNVSDDNPDGVVIQCEYAADVTRYRLKIPVSTISLMHTAPLYFECYALDDDGVNRKTARIHALPAALYSDRKTAIPIITKPIYFSHREPCVFWGEYYGEPSLLQLEYGDERVRFTKELSGKGSFVVYWDSIPVLEGEQTFNFHIGEYSYARRVERYILGDKQIPLRSIRDKNLNAVIETLHHEKIPSSRDDSYLTFIKQSPGKVYTIILCSRYSDVAEIAQELHTEKDKNIGYVVVDPSPTIFEILHMRDFIYSDVVEDTDNDLHIVLCRDTAQWLEYFGAYFRKKPLFISVVDPEISLLRNVTADMIRYHTVRLYAHSNNFQAQSYPSYMPFVRVQALSFRDYYHALVLAPKQESHVYHFTQNDMKYHRSGDVVIYERIDATRQPFSFSLKTNTMVPVITTHNIRMFHYKTGNSALLMLNGLEAKVIPNSINYFYFHTKNNEWTVYNSNLPVAPIFSEIFDRRVMLHTNSELSPLWINYYKRIPSHEGDAIVCYNATVPESLAQQFHIIHDAHGFRASNGEYIKYSQRFIAVFKNDTKLLLFFNTWKPEYFEYPYNYVIFSKKDGIERIGWAWQP